MHKMFFAISACPPESRSERCRPTQRQLRAALEAAGSRQGLGSICRSRLALQRGSLGDGPRNFPDTP